MKQIKTIVASLDNGSTFDDTVNECLRDGWELIERRLVQPPAQLSDGSLYWGTTLYAELEKEDSPACEVSVDYSAAIKALGAILKRGQAKQEEEEA